MPGITTGRKVLITALTKIVNSSEASIDQKLEACKILAALQSKSKTEQPKKEEKRKKETGSKLLG